MTLLISLLLSCSSVLGDVDDTGSPFTSDGGTTSDGGSDGGVEADGGTATDGGTEPPPPPALSLDISGSVIDPLRGDPVQLLAQIQHMGTDVLVDVEILDPDGAVVLTLGDDVDPTADDSDGELEWVDLSWDGRDADGAPVATGTYTATVTMLLDDEVVDTQTASLYVVRTGLLTGTWGSPTGDDGRVALLWHKAVGASAYWNDGAVEDAFRLREISQGEGADEVATEVPAVWEDTQVPPAGWDDVNLPQGYAWDANPQLTLTLGGDLGDAADIATWTARIDGWDLVDGSVADGTLTFAKADKLSATVGVVEGHLDLVLSADDQAVMTQAVPYRAYAMIGPATFTSAESPHMAWVDAIDQACRGIDGTEATDEAVLSALIEWIFDESELRYDTTSGASFYMSYSGGWSGGRFNFRGFLDRTNGFIVNCSDCSGIAGVFANMLGVGLDYSIILSNFDLNEIKAIGVADYTSCPFGPWGCGFSYHAVTTNNLSASIWDATLALDGDKDPGSEPWTELLVQEISGEEYLERLVRSGRATYNYDDSRVRIQ